MEAGHAENPISQEESYVFLRSPLILEEILFCLELLGAFQKLGGKEEHQFLYSNSPRAPPL